MLGCISIVMLPIPVLLFKFVVLEIALKADSGNKFARDQKWVGWKSKIRGTWSTMCPKFDFKLHRLIYLAILNK